MAAETSSRLLQAFRSSRILQLGLALTCVLLFAGIFGPSLLVDRSPNQISQSVMAPPSADFLFGTDELGRSVLTQIVYGVRTSLVVGLAAAATAMTLGVVMGAVGGYFGARLAAAGHDVSFIARGALLDAIRTKGLKVESPLGDLHLTDAKATPDPAAVGPVDVVLFAVKLWDTEKAAEQARPLVGPPTRIITLQNGVDSVERIAPILGADKVAGGTAYIASVMKEPGVISHTSQFARVRCGRARSRPTA